MIHTLTLNPALDKILYVEKFTRNITTRISRVVDTIGGKGTHVSVNLHIMGARNRAYGIAHGPVGQRVIDMLEQEGVDVRFLHSAAHNTRTNYLLAEATGDATLITEKGVRLTRDNLDSVVDKLAQEVQPGDYLALCGDAANYDDPFVYNHIMHALAGCGLRFFVDTSGRSLKKIVEAAPFLIKPNLDELSMLVGHDVPAHDDAVAEAIRSLTPYGIEVVAVSLGGDGSVVGQGGEIWRAYPPGSVRVQNTVGCGDCYLAGLLYGFDAGLAFANTLRYATAAGAAAAECALSVGLDAARAQELLPDVRIEKL